SEGSRFLMHIGTPVLGWPTCFERHGKSGTEHEAGTCRTKQHTARQFLFGHFIERSTAAMHGNKVVGVQLLERRNRAAHIRIRHWHQVETANNRVNFGDARYTNGSAH